MARGLSGLQKEILIMGYENRSKNPTGVVDLLNRQVLIEIYNFEPNTNIDEAKPGALVFNREAIGIKKYQAASTSVSVCFNRLVCRGLASREWNYGIKLTDAGLRLAGELLKY